MLAFENIILPVAKEYNPQLILVSAGFDAAKGDPSSGYQEGQKVFTKIKTTDDNQNHRINIRDNLQFRMANNSAINPTSRLTD